MRYVLLVLLALFSRATFAEPLDRAGIAALIEPPYQLGESVGDRQWQIINLDGRVAGYAFETASIAPLPGFSGAPINLLVTMDLEGTFIDAEILEHNEPIFVSGLGEAPFHEFIAQYRGVSMADSLVVGVPYGDADAASSLVYLEGVTKATASVRIAHESLLAGAFHIARTFLQGVATAPPAAPDLTYQEDLDWEDLVAQGLATRRLVTNAEVQAAFADTLWADDDPTSDDFPNEPYLDLWIVDLGPPAIAQVMLDDESLANLAQFQSISTHDEPLLLIEVGRHGLVSEDFVRNTSPDLISAKQDGLPIALRDSDLDFTLREGIPEGTALILRTDRRLGYDPTRPLTFSVRAVREHGFFRPDVGTVDFTVDHKTDERFFKREQKFVAKPAWQEAIDARFTDLLLLTLLLIFLTGALLFAMRKFSLHRHYIALRLSVLALVIVFVGWWGQGQLSVVTVMGVLRSIWENQNMAFLLYDPFSLLIWGFTLLSFVLWGRGYFCGWLCPFGAMQEFAHYLGRTLGLKQIQLPSKIDRILVYFKYVVLFVLVATAIISPVLHDQLVEVEPFKTAVTTFFVREWYYVAYAVLWITLGMFLFKGFCRYVCPLGAFMALGGLLRGRDWIERREECGSPCQLCKVSCRYQAIEKSGRINYSECFQCLDCVTIFHDDDQCVPLRLKAKGRVLKAGRA